MAADGAGTTAAAAPSSGGQLAPHAATGPAAGSTGSTGVDARAVTPPAIRTSEGAAYPSEARSAGIRQVVEVPLRLTVDAAGKVTEASVERPVGHGFDEAALAAARKLEFFPATRGGKPVAARIRFVYRFTPPPIVVVAPSPRASLPATLPSTKGGENVAPAPALAEVETVEVRGGKPPREVTKRTLERREIERIPGTNGDALRSIETLPGVARPPSLSGLLIVRGSAPEDTQYFVDGTPVPIVYHFGGLSSVLPTEMLDRIDFYPGNFSARYGRAMGGIVDVGLREPQHDKLHGMAQADFIDARVLAEGPVFDTGWTFAVAGRRSYVDAWLGPVLAAGGAGVSVTPVYYDLQAVARRDWSSRSSMRVAFFGSDDKLDVALNGAGVSATNPDLAGEIGTHIGFWRAQALYKGRLSDAAELRIVGAVGEDHVSFNAGNLSFDLTDWPITSRVELAAKIDPRLTMNVGLDWVYSPYAVSAQLPAPGKAGEPPPGPFSAQPLRNTSSTGAITEPAFYAEWEATPWSGGRIVPGLRVDYTGSTESWDYAPRVTVRQDVTSDPRTTLKGGIGLYAQPPQARETDAVFGTPGLRSNRSLQYDLGVERVLTESIEGSIDGFYKQLDNLVEQGLGNTGSGSVYGAEVLVRVKPSERFFGWVAYTLSRSVRRTQPSAPMRMFEYDETHVLTAIGSYRVGGGWEIGARYRLTSGYMYTPNAYGFYDENAGVYLPLAAYPPYGARLPLFHALDVRVDKSCKYRWGTLSAYLDIVNVYNNGNVDGISYDFNYTHAAPAGDLPFLPSLGLRVEN